VRVDTAEIAKAQPDVEILRAVLNSPDDEGFLYTSLPPPVHRGDWTTTRRLPQLTDGAATLVVETIGTSSPGVRRDLALARTARALALINT
jgi:hypothetical protein